MLGPRAGAPVRRKDTHANAKTVHEEKSFWQRHPDALPFDRLCSSWPPYNRFLQTAWDRQRFRPVPDAPRNVVASPRPNAAKSMPKHENQDFEHGPHARSKTHHGPRLAAN